MKCELWTSQHLATLKICKPNNGRRFKVFFRHRNSKSAAEKQLKQRKHCKKHCFLVVSMEKVVFREGNIKKTSKVIFLGLTW